MDNTISFTVNQLIGFITTVGGCIVVIEAVVLIIFKLVSKVKAPEAEQNKRIEALEKKVEELEKGRKSDNDEFGEIKKTNKVILKCLQALLAESLGGNAAEALNEAKKELDNYFLEK